MYVLNEISKKMAEGLTSEFDNLFINGLKLKGYEFNHPAKLHEFVKENCRCEDYPIKKTRTYFVNDIPFFVHFYEIDFNYDISQTETNTTLTANYGHYKYL